MSECITSLVIIINILVITYNCGAYLANSDIMDLVGVVNVRVQHLPLSWVPRPLIDLRQLAILLCLANDILNALLDTLLLQVMIQGCIQLHLSA